MKIILREIKLEGSFNFRDLGGYETLDGRRVKQGLLYRSGNLSRLTDHDQKILKQLDIKNVCDLRGLDEVKRFPDPVFDDATWHHTPILPDEQVMGQVGAHQDFANMLRNTRPGEMLLNLNQRMVSYKKAFQNVFNVLLNDPQSPFLFHCMAGKDRTGAVAALMLSILGVPRETIEEDYLYTNATKAEAAAHFEAIGYNDLRDIDQEVLEALYEARAEYINTFLDEIESRYENTTTYTTEVLGLSKDELATLKRYLLE